MKNEMERLHRKEKSVSPLQLFKCPLKYFKNSNQIKLQVLYINNKMKYINPQFTNYILEYNPGPAVKAKDLQQDSGFAISRFKQQSSDQAEQPTRSISGV